MAGAAAAVLYGSQNASAAQVKAPSKTRASQALVGDHTKARVELPAAGTIRERVFTGGVAGFCGSLQLSESLRLHSGCAPISRAESYCRVFRPFLPEAARA